MPRKTDTAEAVKETETQAAVKEVKQENLMYVGPTIPGIGIQNRVYTEIPEAARKACKNVPEMRSLFIPVIKYPIAEKMLREGKGYIFSAFKKALKYREGGKTE